MLTRLITPPAEEPVTLAEAKAQLRLETALDDAFVTRLIRAAREWAEGYLWRGIVSQTWELVLEGFPAGAVELPMGQLTSITSVKYLDELGAEQTLSASIYEADTASVPGKLRLAYSQSWPSARGTWNAVVVRYVVGWATASAVPQPIKQALLMLISQMYEHRTPEITGTIVSPVQFAVEALLSRYRLMTVA